LDEAHKAVFPKEQVLTRDQMVQLSNSLRGVNVAEGRSALNYGPQWNIFFKKFGIATNDLALGAGAGAVDIPAAAAVAVVVPEGAAVAAMAAPPVAVLPVPAAAVVAAAAAMLISVAAGAPPGANAPEPIEPAAPSAPEQIEPAAPKPAPKKKQMGPSHEAGAAFRQFVANAPTNMDVEEDNRKPAAQETTGGMQVNINISNR
jgi:hypothetical protein